MKKSKYIFFNWKMNPISVEQAEELARISLWRTRATRNVFIAPPFVYLERCMQTIRRSNEHALGLAAQDVSIAKSGAYTGEISPAMLKELGVTHVIVGHSERRRLFKETDALVAQKIATLQEGGLVPVLCVGELRKTKTLTAAALVCKQLEQSLALAVKSKALVVAYESVWAIGGDKEVDVSYAHAVIEGVRHWLRDYWRGKFVLLYGGSVTGVSAPAFLEKNSIDGLLVGSASLKSEEIEKIVGAL